jgi:hypothetical protein
MHTASNDSPEHTLGRMSALHVLGRVGRDDAYLHSDLAISAIEVA